MDYKKIGEFISNRRKEIGLTQKQLGEKLNVTDKAVSKWETGQGCPDVSLLGELSELLDVGIGEILNGEYNEDLRNNSLFIKNAVDYSKRITENNIYDNIKKVLYFILIFICLYISFNGVRQFIYLSGNVKFEKYNDDTYKQYEKLKSNVKLIKEKGYLIYNDKKGNYSVDFSENLDYLILKLEYTNLFNNNKIKNTEVDNIEVILNNIDVYSSFVIYQLKSIDEENYKFYDLLKNNISYETNCLAIDNIYEIDCYSASLYEYDEIKDNSKTVSEYYHIIGVKLGELNRYLEFLIEVGESNEKN